MKYTRLISLALCAALFTCLLASCGGSDSSSSSEAAEQSEASASGILPSDDENSVLTFTDPDEAFESAVGWGAGTAGTSLKAMVAANDMMGWAEENKLAANSGAGAAENLLKKWYSSLSDVEKEGLSEAWPIIKSDAEAILDDKDGVADLAETAGLDIKKLPACSEKNWDALSDIMDKIVPAAVQ